MLRVLFRANLLRRKWYSAIRQEIIQTVNFVTTKRNVTISCPLPVCHRNETQRLNPAGESTRQRKLNGKLSKQCLFHRIKYLTSGIKSARLKGEIQPHGI